ncbi:UNVERIFIED_CONTAM: hypothetical protein Slati_3090700 [Sesamum latifolium]|uniref:Uncharacterized protein n=1 Tax=Sesamum latifolium TaxID=2727402 RepID=A0AAW2UVN3_9LAMI
MCVELFSQPQGTPPIPQSEAQRWKLGDNVERLNAENVKLKEAKKEVTSRNEQLEKELKKLQREVASHEGPIRKAVDKAMLDFPNTEEGQHYLKGYWASCLKEYKKFEEYQDAVARIAGPFLERGS